jgi:hypothetical protein
MVTGRPVRREVGLRDPVCLMRRCAALTSDIVLVQCCCRWLFFSIVAFCLAEGYSLFTGIV